MANGEPSDRQPGLFDVTSDAYDRFMGRFSGPLADRMLEVLPMRPDMRVLDVGCGPGALTTRLAAALGVAAVSAVDPSASFVAAVRDRLPGVAVSQAAAEVLPYDDGAFDAAFAQLVVHFMRDPVAGLAEMRRVTRTGGALAASVWDHGGGGGPLSLFWDTLHRVDPTAAGERGLAGARAGHLAELALAAGWRQVVDSSLVLTVAFGSFADWWTPYTLGVGPAGAYVRDCGPERREVLRAACAERLSAGPFEVTARAWFVTGSA